ncbi:uncharacterized protein LOC120086992 [Benincasa hispida]|uniref:uncharacterized protein LOC120086992 n=1 Tax=Benincasa hispida TaxID=102211 RepID=UPI00190139D4|nr:uncharacterized protein LOC120086992 [Benincasa hispida]
MPPLSVFYFPLPFTCPSSRLNSRCSGQATRCRQLRKASFSRRQPSQQCPTARSVRPALTPTRRQVESSYRFARAISTSRSWLTSRWILLALKPTVRAPYRARVCSLQQVVHPISAGSFRAFHPRPLFTVRCHRHRWVLPNLVVLGKGRDALAIDKRNS